MAIFRNKIDKTAELKPSFKPGIKASKTIASRSWSSNIPKLNLPTKPLMSFPSDKVLTTTIVLLKVNAIESSKAGNHERPKTQIAKITKTPDSKIVWATNSLNTVFPECRISFQFISKPTKNSNRVTPRVERNFMASTLDKPSTPHIPITKPAKT